ncbi:ATP-binding cassette domain-containing protein [Sphingobium phenoxybenzoativorans]|uniref:ATP-binding cassette domain-containing protein n=1 Tax=Sphingobium phenoxybenzoativorans TaxID=1592790 RepID=A0A975K4Q6_9SPHN|nr:ATP-binding cassette domain-containing protein [Sphingobium phenoxybenzoativorans]QUT04790.1 ATP-binding cassette domain-containing protein [Sphingobium phenoxybenzoativorans]
MSFDVQVTRRMGGTTVSARIPPADGVTVLFGPSGVGKTSILNMVAGILRPDSGHIRIGGETMFDAAAGTDMPAHKRRIGYVFQDGRLFPHRRVRGNLLYGHRLAEARDRWISLEETISFLGIGGLLDRWPASLSGGEAQRVAIGRALLSGARALLMDEPLTSLDRPRREEVMTVIERIRDELHLPILYVTHDPAEAERLGAQRIEIAHE